MSEMNQRALLQMLLIAPVYCAIIGLSFASPVSGFSDDFETDMGWSRFEEIVGGSSCYGDALGGVSRTTEVAFSGSQSLLIWANQQRSNKSNHVIGQKKVAASGQGGRWLYTVYAYIDPATGQTGQTGPEVSVQNTRRINNQFLTATAGVQYLPQEGTWNIWMAGWQYFLTKALIPGHWYYIAIEVDYDSNQYHRFWLWREGEIDLSIDLTGYNIALEDKQFTEEALWLTVESENLWNNCGTAGVFQYRVYYDSVRLVMGPAPTLYLNQAQFQRGDNFSLRVAVTPGPTPITADVYIALQPPGCTSFACIFFWQGGLNFTATPQPLLRNWLISPFNGPIFTYTFGGTEPVGGYIWLGAFVVPGTGTLMGGITQAPFTFSP